MEGNSTDSNVTSVRPRRKLLTRKRLIILGLIIILSGLVGGAYYINNRNKVMANDQCSTNQQRDTLQQEVYKGLSSDDRLKLKPSVEKIQKIQGYENDPNCMYPIVIYDIARGDSSAADEALIKFNKVYDGKGLAPAYGPNTTSPQQLRKKVDALLEQKKTMKNQFDILNQEPPKQ